MVGKNRINILYHKLEDIPICLKVTTSLKKIDNLSRAHELTLKCLSDIVSADSEDQSPAAAISQRFYN